MATNCQFVTQENLSCLFVTSIHSVTLAFSHRDFSLSNVSVWTDKTNKSVLYCGPSINIPCEILHYVDK